MNQTPKTILLVEDDAALAKLIEDYLSKYGYIVSTLYRGDTALVEIPILQPDLVILDLMLPGLDGLSICRQVKPRFVGPILMLTALSESVDIVTGLEIGADDYLAKPVEPRVLLARVRALFRRMDSVIPASAVSGIIRMPKRDILICSNSRTLTVRNEVKGLTTHEFDLLWLLASRAGTVMSRDSIYQQLRGIPFDGVDRSMDIRISTLRKCLQDRPEHPEIIKTVRGKGYLFVAEI